MSRKTSRSRSIRPASQPVDTQAEETLPLEAKPAEPVSPAAPRRNDVVTLSRKGIDPSARHVVLAVGSSFVRVVPEGAARTASFKVRRHEVGSTVVKATPKATAKDKTGKPVTRVVYVESEGYWAFLTRGKTHLRVARIESGKVKGAGELRNGGLLSAVVYDLAYQTAGARDAILSNPESAPAPEDLGLVS